ncbi:MAG: hypothetical protein DSM106950_19790 [Stigonema ocellatum SAG 48.90 = DSM 106950]|nr:hypothetical protein [Stigonema ocellatum SAG 48.90 = DSM 106950]
MEFSIQLSKTTFLFWQSCIAAENLDTGKVVDSHSCQQANTTTLGRIDGRRGRLLPSQLQNLIQEAKVEYRAIAFPILQTTRSSAVKKKTISEQ